MRLSGETKVVGVFGDPVAHSLSPPMQNAAFQRSGLNWVYVPFHVQPGRLAAAVKSVAALGLAGVNVTVPHKVNVIKHLDQVDTEAQWIGAVNTIVNRDGRLVGFNTDGLGFVRSLKRQARRDPQGAHVVIVGAGGAAQAIAYSMALNGAGRVTISNRTLDKAQALAHLIDDKTRSDWAPLSADDAGFVQALGDADILVHATAVGMHPHHDVPSAVPVELLNPSTLVCDIVYTPRETSLIQQARAHGCPVLTGEGMLAYQGAVAFELWTGREAPEDLMLETLRKLLSEAL